MDELTTDKLVLYRTASGHPVTYTDIVTALRESGVSSGDCIFVHSDISRFGLTGEISSRRTLLDLLIKALKEVVTESGTIIMPTFTYSFTKGEVYDPDRSPSTVGLLTEYFRRQDNTVRTMHPIFSVAIWGAGKDELSANLAKDSFGRDSIFGRLYARDGDILFFGAPFQSCTFIHYVEKLVGVSYRYLKTFEGTIRKGDAVIEDKCQFLVRDLDREIITDLSRLEARLLRSGVMTEVSLGDGQVLRVGTSDMVEAGTKALGEDAYFFLKQAPRERV